MSRRKGSDVCCRDCYFRRGDTEKCIKDRHQCTLVKGSDNCRLYGCDVCPAFKHTAGEDDREGKR